MNIIELSREYVRQRALAAASVVHYGYVAEIFVRDMGIREVSEVTREVLLDWRAATLARGVSGATWNNYLRHMRALLGFAAGRQMLSPDTRDISDLAVRAHMERPKTVCAEDLKKVMTYVSSGHSATRPRWYWAILFRTLYYTGMRRLQLTELRWSDVDFKNATIRLRAMSSKTRRGWIVPIVELLMPSLLELRERTLAAVGEDTDIQARHVFDISLFSTQYRSCQGGKMTTQSISNFFSRVRHATGIGVSAHMLRHTMATDLARLGLYRELQSLLGHTDIQTTMRYVHPKIDQLRLMAENLSDLDA